MRAKSRSESTIAMITRHPFLLFAPPAFVVALVVAWLIWQPAGITEANAARIKNGMTLAEVEAILDGPARDEISWATDGHGGWTKWIKVWASRQIEIRVYFNADWQVIEASCSRFLLAPESPLAMLRRLFGF